MIEPQSYRFGPFTFDPTEGRLLRGDQRIDLQPQPMRLLQLLLDRPDRLVAHDAIRRHLWPERIVDYESALPFCVRRLRIALGDDARAPSFVETVPGRGLRFVAPLIRDEGPSRAAGRPARTEGQARDLPVERGRRWRLRSSLVAALLACLLLTALPASDRRERSDRRAPVLVVLPPAFDPASGNGPAIAETLHRQLLTHLTSAEGVTVADGTSPSPVTVRPSVPMLVTRVHTDGVRLRIEAAIRTHASRPFWRAELESTRPALDDMSQQLVLEIRSLLARRNEASVPFEETITRVRKLDLG